MIYLSFSVVALSLLIFDCSGAVSRIFRVLKSLSTNFRKGHALTRGKDLYELMIHNSPHGRQYEIPHYKFYDCLYIRINDAARKLGAQLIKPMAIIKKSLLQDLAFEKKIQDFYFQTNFQFLIMMAICWFFTFYSSQLLGIKPKLWTQIVLLIWQVIGILSFSLIFKSKRDRIQRSFSPVYLNFLSYQSLLSVSLPIASIRKICDFNALSNVDYAGIDFYLRRFFNLVKLREKFGRATEEDLDLLLDDINRFYEVCLEKLLRQLNVLKFIWLCVFFLSTYLASVYSSLLSVLI